MDLKGICLLFVILTVALISSTEGKPPCKYIYFPLLLQGNAASILPSFLLYTVKKVCPADPRIRVNCGYPGITAKECLSRRCCFRAHPAGVPWCFYHRTVEEGKIQVRYLPCIPTATP
ncbi:hypothetical protein CIB84_000661 [Bambusicola thoracicus]|uniref:P-type domain-containing protein n=1 Tax=Bambusicola thoracicus TaxID=9083 RepID=A0A2P4TGV1_BAMTH|nr:hypothetical protein CIB84_000661 [Bambusicola thoracicus]